MRTSSANTEEISLPAWIQDGKTLNEPLFCEEFLANRKIKCINDIFIGTDGEISESSLSAEICGIIGKYIKSGLAKKTENIIKYMKLRCFENEMTVSDKEIHLLNGVLFTDGSFLPAKRFCTNRLNVNFMTQKYLTEHRPDNFMKFLGELLEPDDILTLQEYLGYCLIPTTAAQKALFIIGNGGEGKSCIGIVLSAIFGDSMVSGNFQSIETDRFSRYKLCNKLLMIDDDMQMTALPSTGIIKNLITSQIPVEVEAKGKQSRQVKLYSRFLCFGNGSPRSLYDKSDGFVRRLLILTTKPVPKDRVTDPNIMDRFIAEKDMIFMWMFEGLCRLLSNNFHLSG